MSEITKVHKVVLGPAQCALDLSDGSERGPYVNQDYILHKLGRPHRSINLMFCYYPLDEGWPVRASLAHASDDVSFAWDYPYDDYFPYGGGLNGSKTSDVFEYMRDIRRHGQDVQLTLTLDPHLSDDHLIAIAKDLTTFGRVLMRINHEATGDWFSFTKRATYQEIADFYVHFHKILKQYAPNVTTILCAGGMDSYQSGKIEKEEEFKQAIQTTDIWSIDRYLALHWGWPYDIAEKGGSSHNRYQVKAVVDYLKASYDRFCELNDGTAKPMVMSELNADGDVTGPYEQAAMVKEFATLIKESKDKWLSAFTLYQFRDDGKLGLEMTDPNNAACGIEQPLLKTYREILHDNFFSPSLTLSKKIVLPTTLRWGGAQDSEGLALTIHLKAAPIFFEIYFEDELLPMSFSIKLKNNWFYKAPGTKCLDLMEAFYESTECDDSTIILYLFATPITGENDATQGADWQINYYTVIHSLPKLRIRYQPIEA